MPVLLTPPVLTGLLVAFACGLLVGIDRERRKGSGPARAFAGLRTFALASFTGALAQALGVVLLAGSLLAVLIAVAYWRDRSDDPGITTELALFLSFLLGVAAIDNPAVAAGSAVVLAGLLHLRSPLHHFARVSLTRTELRDALLFAAAALVVRPLLPDASSAWLAGINPRSLWTLALLIMAIQLSAHVAVRLAGPRLGLAMSGFGAGWVSSVATTASMGARCRANPALLGPAVAGALLSNVATFALLWVVALTVAPAHLRPMLPVLAGGLLAAMAAGALALAVQGRSEGQGEVGSRLFDIRQALLFAALLSMASTALAALNAWLGSAALLSGTAIAGFFDVHAAAGSALTLLQGGVVSVEAAQSAVLLAITTNTCSKGAAAMAGGWRFAVRVNSALAVILLCAWLPFLLQRW